MLPGHGYRSQSSSVRLSMWRIRLANYQLLIGAALATGRPLIFVSCEHGSSEPGVTASRDYGSSRPTMTPRRRAIDAMVGTSRTSWAREESVVAPPGGQSRRAASASPSASPRPRARAPLEQLRCRRQFASFPSDFAGCGCHGVTSPRPCRQMSVCSDMAATDETLCRAKETGPCRTSGASRFKRSDRALVSRSHGRHCSEFLTV